MSAPGAPPPMPPPTAPPPPMPPPMYGPPPMMMPPPERTGLPIAGGVLLIVGAIIGIINDGLILALGAAAAGAFPGIGAELFVVCGALGVIFSILALVGGIMALQRKMWALGLIGGILGIFAVGFLFITSILCLIGVILIGVAKKEFTS